MVKIITINAINQDVKIVIQEDLLVLDTYCNEKVNSQAELLVLSVENLLHKNNLSYSDIDILSIIRGPGSFISIKSTISFAKAFEVITGKKIIENDVFEIISFQKEPDYVVLNGGFGFFYIKDKNQNYSQQKKEDFTKLLNQNTNIITNNQDIFDYLSKFCSVELSISSIKDIVKLNHIKTINENFSKKIEPLYIGQPQINIKKK